MTQGSLPNTKTEKRGFTIVELLIVIVVIAILAAITIVAYNGVQQRARDSRRKSDLGNIEKALKLYAVDNGDYIYKESGCGSSGNGSGYLNYKPSTYPKSIAQCLVDSGVVSSVPSDPSGQTSCSGMDCHVYLKYTCGLGTYLYANLEASPHDGSETDGTCYAEGDTERGVNYVVKVD
jgi:type II secretion system protein G